jgi:hypothetical protein
MRILQQGTQSFVNERVAQKGYHFMSSALTIVFRHLQPSYISKFKRNSQFYKGMTLNRSKKPASSQTARRRQRSEQQVPIKDTNRKRKAHTSHRALLLVLRAKLHRDAQL